jgi:hypothetical protein
MAALAATRQRTTPKPRRNSGASFFPAPPPQPRNKDRRPRGLILRATRCGYTTRRASRPALHHPTSRSGLCEASHGAWQPADRPREHARPRPRQHFACRPSSVLPTTTGQAQLAANGCTWSQKCPADARLACLPSCLRTNRCASIPRDCRRTARRAPSCRICHAPVGHTAGGRRPSLLCRYVSGFANAMRSYLRGGRSCRRLQRSIPSREEKSHEFDCP